MSAQTKQKNFSFYSVRSDSEIVDRAYSAIQHVMSCLEDKFQHVLIQNTVPLDAERLYGSIRQSSLSFSVNDAEIIAGEDGMSVVVSDFSSGCGWYGFVGRWVLREI